MINYLFLATKPVKIIYVSMPILGMFLAYFHTPYTFNLNHIYFLLVFIVFYGALYMYNDLIDYDIDKKDKYKKDRIIASGKLSRNFVKLYIIFVLIISLIIFLNISVEVFTISIILLVINLIYPLFIKKVAYLDTLFILSTNTIKTVLGIVFISGFTLLPYYFPLLLIFYFRSYGVGLQKVLKEISLGQKRDYIIGNYSVSIIKILQTISLILMLIVFFLIEKQSISWYLGIITILYYSVFLVFMNFFKGFEKLIYHIVNMVNRT